MSRKCGGSQSGKLPATFNSVQARSAKFVSPEIFLGEPLDEREIDRLLAAVSLADTEVLIYTSGTTGPPKGAMVSHANVLTLLDASSQIRETFASDLSLNFLPMAHAAERIFGFFARIDSGVGTAYARSMGSVLEDLGEVLGVRRHTA